MPTIIIQGYNYGKAQSIGLVLTYYIYGSTPAFTSSSVSSFGAYVPSISLSNEGGKVVIFIDDKPYYPRFTISAFAQGLSADAAASYTNWAVSDAALTGTNTVVVPYKNGFLGSVTMPGSGIWNSSGNVGIGTIHPDQALTVKGQVHSTSVLIESTVPADYVFNNDYYLRPLADVKTYVDKNHHLPEVPSAAEFKKDGMNVGDMNMTLLKKVEELTLYLIEKDLQIKALQQRNAAYQSQQKQIDELKKSLEKLVRGKIKK